MQQSLEENLREAGITLYPTLFYPEGDPIPPEFHPLKDYVAETVRFAHMEAILSAAWKIVSLYRVLYARNLFYMGNGEESFYFHARTAQMLLYCRKPEKEFWPMGFLLPGRAAYDARRAPELYGREDARSSEESENWTLAYYLYELFMHGSHPLKGWSSMSQVFLSPEEERKWLALHGSFVMESAAGASVAESAAGASVVKNHPVHGVQDRLARYWEIYPEEMREAFKACFEQGKENRESRLSPEEWFFTINRLRNEYIVCGCGSKGFAHTFERTEEGNLRCPKCRNTFYVFKSPDSEIYLANDKDIYAWQVDASDYGNNEVIGRVVENKAHKGIFGIKNLSRQTWMGRFSDGTVKEIRPEAGIPVWRGLEVTFPGNRTFAISGAQHQAADTPEPVREYPQPDREEPQPIREYPQPDRAEPQPIREYPQPDREESQPDRTKPQPDKVDFQPDRTEPQPDKADFQLNRVEPQPDREYLQPDRVEPQPDREYPQPDRAELQPNRAESQPDREYPQPDRMEMKPDGS